MEMLTNWFHALDPHLRIYWGIAIFASVIFVIQMVMSFIGIGDFDDGSSADMDFGGDGGTDSMDDAGALHLLSIRNVVYFLLGLGWAGISLWGSITSPALLLVVAVLVGCLFVAIFLVLFRQMMKLQHNGSFDINDAVGKVCDVYLRIPTQGLGKVQISFGGSVQELDARTLDNEEIPSGSRVRVVEVIDRHVLVVERV